VALPWVYSPKVASYESNGGAGTLGSGAQTLPFGHTGTAGTDTKYGQFLFTGAIADGSIGTINQTINGLCVGAPYTFSEYHLTDFYATDYSYAGGCALIYSLDTTVITSIDLPVIQPSSTVSYSSATASITPTANIQTLIAALTCSDPPQGTVLFAIDDINIVANPYGIQKRN